jgi:pimeloyl-ACP methyl ester carboxylesterase
MKEAVVLVHGIWSNGIDLWRLRLKLKQAGYDVHIFNYHVWQAPAAELAQKLHDRISNIDADVIHFVGHSFGGIIVLHLFDQFPFATRCKNDGRIVLLGCPVNGSEVGKRVSRSAATRWALGHTIDAGGLFGDVPEWKGWQDIGVIAGSVPLGIGMLTGGPEFPHDGTVSVAETRLKNATDFVVLPVSHSGMLISAEVAHHVITFLRAGRFDDDTRTPLLEAGVSG